MKIVLKRDWDMQISPPLKEEKLKGHYGGREKEVEMLTNELLRGKKGSILISGYRGVGKTSLVYKALWSAQENDDNIIFILLNAAQLEIDPTKDEIEPRKILENLIRRLFSTTYEDNNLNSSVRSKIKSLYRKAIASDFKKSEISTIQNEYIKEAATEEKVDIVLNEKNLIFIISWSLAMALQFMPFLPWEGINKIVPMLLAFPVPYSLNILYKKYSISKKIELEKDISEELYKFDNNLGNLEFDLEKLHREISNEGKKLVYVIDELDKLDPKYTDKILNYFKNFFTLSDAIFIFIGGEEIYNLDSLNQKNPQKEMLYRTKNYTYFTSKYFIPRPLWDDLKGFLDSIVDQIDEGEQGQFEIIKRALCFESKNDFYDIKYCIKDRIKEFDDKDQPIIDIILSEEDVQKARYHKAITILFEEKYRLLGPSKWKVNETLYRCLFEHAYKLYSSYAGCLIEDLTGDDPQSEMLRDFNNFMYRIEAFELEKKERRQIERNNHSGRHAGISELIDVLTYRYNGHIPNEPPCHFNRPTEFENRFINNYIKLYRHVLSLFNALRVAEGNRVVTEEEFLSELKDYRRESEIISNSHFDTLITYLNDFNILSKSANEYSKRREETEKNLKILETQIDALIRILPNIISNIIKNLVTDIDNLKYLKENVNYFPILDASQRSALGDCRVLLTKDKLKQLIFLPDINKFNKISKEIKTNSSTYRAIIFSERSNKPEIKGGHIVIVESPDALRSSLDELFKDIKIFYTNKKK
jgi:hypothetical protein